VISAQGGRSPPPRGGGAAGSVGGSWGWDGVAVRVGERWVEGFGFVGPGVEDGSDEGDHGLVVAVVRPAGPAAGGGDAEGVIARADGDLQACGGGGVGAMDGQDGLAPADGVVLVLEQAQADVAIHAGAESVAGEEVAEAFQALELVLLPAFGLGDIKGHTRPRMTAILGVGAPRMPSGNYAS